MLARLVFRQLCRFSEANGELNLYKPHLKKYFDGDVSKVGWVGCRLRRRAIYLPKSTTSRKREYRNCSK
jgi:hypothetical protein